MNLTFVPKLLAEPTLRLREGLGPFSISEGGLHGEEGISTMIPEVDRRLREWARQVLGDVGVTLAPPGREEGSAGVSFYLLALESEAPAETTGRRQLGVALRYLVTAWADTPSEAHRLLGEIASAALLSAEHEVDFEAVPHEVWTAFGTPPRPSFRLRVPVTVDTERPPAKRVTEPMELVHSPLHVLHGQVVSSGNRPVPDVTVEVPFLDLRTKTDGKGRFSFPAVPSNPPITTLKVRGKGVGGLVRLDEDGVPTSEPLVIRLSDLEA